MNLQEIKSIKFSLLKRDSDTNEDNLAEYLKLKTAKFTFPSDFPRTEEMFSALCEDMYADLNADVKEDPDYLGLWIEYDSFTIDNALSLQTLNDIQEYSKDEINPAWEFFKMTANE